MKLLIPDLFSRFAQVLCALLGTALSVLPSDLKAHGFEGDRFFPPTITSDDPFAADDFAETVSVFKNPSTSENPGREIDVTTEFDKELFPKFALAVDSTYSNFHPDGGPSYDGFQNLELGAKYQAYENPKHEFIFSVGGTMEIGGTGSDGSGIGDSFSTFTPTLYFGKGMGDLGDQFSALRPLAFTGVLGQSFPSEGVSQNSLNWSGAIEYSIPYLQQNVHDFGLPAPIRNMIPVVEFNLQSAENHNAGGDYSPELTTGTINPGIMWEGKYFQIGAEALIPINENTGPDVGAVIQVHIFIDDLLPRIFGRPLLGQK